MPDLTFRISQAAYWSKCAAFARFTDGVRTEANDAAREGTCASWVAEVVLNSVEGIACDDMVGKIHSNGWVVTPEMADDVQGYVDTVCSYGDDVFAEREVVASDLPYIPGRVDAESIDASGILRITDLKYGRRVVEANSPSMICYGFAGMRNHTNISAVHLAIYQPRASHPAGKYRVCVMTPDEVHTEFVKLWHMANEGAKPDSAATPGVHCKGCAAAAGCRALAESTYDVHDVITSRNFTALSAADLARELDFTQNALALITAREKAVMTEAVARAKSESIPGWRMSSGLGRSVFTTSAATLQLMTGVDPYQKKLCTPAELIRRGADESVVKSFSKRPETGMKLTKFDSDDIAALFRNDS